MSHLCDSTVAGPTARRDQVLASKCEYPPFRYPLLHVPEFEARLGLQNLKLTAGIQSLIVYMLMLPPKRAAVRRRMSRKHFATLALQPTPTLENTLLGVGVCKREGAGGCNEIPAAGLRNMHPPPFL